MQRPHPAKRDTIVDAAAALFASRPFHEVRLEEVAEAAGVGKGTLYVYFKSKDDLYRSLVLEAFEQLVDRLRERIESAGDREDAWTTLEIIIRELVLWAKKFPDYFHLLRSAENETAGPRLREKRRELGKVIETVIRAGVRRGELADPNPALTAQFVPACIRAAMRHGPHGLRQDEVVGHILHVLGRGIRGGSGA